MKKIITVHLSNKAFQIEEDAYAYLNNVLNTQWNKKELEAQLSERLEQKLNEAKTVITYPDVVDVLYQLGISAPVNEQSTTVLASKRLYRQPEGKMIAGVCTGLGEYFEIDPVIMRVLFVIAFFLGSMGFWIYVILWIIVPKAPKLLNQ